MSSTVSFEISSKDTEYTKTWSHYGYDGDLWSYFDLTMTIKCTAQNTYTASFSYIKNYHFDYRFYIKAGSNNTTIFDQTLSSASIGKTIDLGSVNFTSNLNKDDNTAFYIYGYCQKGTGCEVCQSENGTTISEVVGTDNDAVTYGGTIMFKITNSISWYTAPSNVGTYKITGISGTTIIINTPTWTNGSNNGSITTATCRIWATNSSGTEVGNAISTTNNGAITSRITGLTTGTTYNINAQVSDGTGNTGSTVTVSSSDGNTSATTYKCSVSISAVSTCRIKYTAQITHGSIGNGTTNQLSRSNLSYYVKQGSTTIINTYVNNGSLSYIITDNVTGGLTHGTSTTVYCYVRGVTDADGNIDTEVYASRTTYTLSLSGTGSTSHQHSIVTTWQAYANSSAQNADNISGTAYYFNNATLSSKNTSGYISQGSDGNTSYSVIYNTSDSYSYSYNKSIYYYNLTYYCQYTATAYLTDGTNTVSATMTVATTYPYARIYYNGAWRKAFVYIYSGGWKLAVGHVYSSGWKEFNGE